MQSIRNIIDYATACFCLPGRTKDDKKIQDKKVTAKDFATPVGVQSAASKVKPEKLAGAKRNSLLQGTSARESIQLEQTWTWLKSKVSINLFIPKNQHTAARRRIQSLIQELQGKQEQVLYIASRQALTRLKHDAEIDEQGEWRSIPGKVEELRQSGGVLIVNVAGFEKGELDAALMDVASLTMDRAQQEGGKLRLICLADKDSFELLSESQFNRAGFAHFPSDYTFSGAADLQTDEYSEHGPDTDVVDLENVGNWRWHMLGGPTQPKKNGPWIRGPGAICTDPSQDAFKRQLVVRNLHDDDLLMDFLLDLQAQGKPVRVEEGLSKDERERRLEAKISADNMVTLRNQLDAPICHLTERTAVHILKSHNGFQNGQLVEYPCLLEQLPAGTHPIVHITENISPGLWDQIMQHPAPFSIAATPGVDIPPEYHGHVFSLPLRENGSFASNTRSGSDNDDPPVRFISSHDPSLKKKTLPQDAIHLDISSKTRGDHLLYGWKRLDDAKGKGRGKENQSPGYELEIGQLIKGLQSGKDVYLYDLESAPAFAQAIASLMQENPNFYLPGQRLHFGQGGGLTGKLYIVTSDNDLINRYPLLPVESDKRTINAARTWNGITEHLNLNFPNHGQSNLEKQVGKLRTLFEAMAQHGFIADKDPPVSYLEIEKLFRYVFVALPPASGSEEERIRERQIRALFKGMLRDIKDYDQVKCWLKVLFDREMSSMPDNSVNADRLQKLIKRANHPDDIKRFAWKFLSTFSTDIIKNVIGDGRDKFDTSKSDRHKMRNAVLTLVRQHDRYTVYEKQPAKLTREQKTEDIADLLLKQGRAIAFKGGPGLGKSRLMDKLAPPGAPNVYRLSIAAEGREDFWKVLKDWANDKGENGPPTLVIDEYNVAGEKTLNILKGMFFDDYVRIEKERIRLSPQHRILLGGNSNLVRGRREQPVVQESIPVIPFKPFSNPELIENFIDPLLSHAASLPELRAMLTGPVQETIRSSVLKIHTGLEHAFPDLHLTPTHMQEYLTQVLCQLLRKQDEGKTVTQDELEPWLASLALSAYGDSLPEHKRALLPAWLKNELNLFGSNSPPLAA